jgi:hypothetical protein
VGRKVAAKLRCRLLGRRAAGRGKAVVGCASGGRERFGFTGRGPDSQLRGFRFGIPGVDIPRVRGNGKANQVLGGRVMAVLFGACGVVGWGVTSTLRYATGR